MRCERLDRRWFPLPVARISTNNPRHDRSRRGFDECSEVKLAADQGPRVTVAQWCGSVAVVDRLAATDRLATTGRLADRSVAAAAVAAEQPRQQAGTLAAGGTDRLATADRRRRGTGGRFATAGGLANRGIAATAVTAEQSRQQAGTLATGVANGLTTTGRFWAADRGFTATNRFGTAGVAVTEQAGRGARRRQRGESKGQHTRGDYTTHRGGLQKNWVLRFSKRDRRCPRSWQPSSVQGHGRTRHGQLAGNEHGDRRGDVGHSRLSDHRSVPGAAEAVDTQQR